MSAPSLIHTSLQRTHCNIQRFEQNCEELNYLYKFALIPWSPGYKAVCEITRDPLLHPRYCRCDRTVFDISSAQINGDGMPLQKPHKYPVENISVQSISFLNQPVKSVANAKITVIFNSTESASVWHANVESFASILSSALAMNLFYVTQHCLVDLEDFDLCGIKYLIFHCNKLNGAHGSLTKNTKIVVRHITDYPSYLRLTANKNYDLAPGLSIPFERLNSQAQEFFKGKQKLRLNKVILFSNID